MQIQINSDRNIEGHEALARRVEEEVGTALDRFSSKLTRVEVHLSDENGGKPGSDDKRCMIEARPIGRQPLAVSHQGDTLEAAVSGATKKLQRALESAFGRSSDQKGGPSIRTREDRRCEFLAGGSEKAG